MLFLAIVVLGFETRSRVALGGTFPFSIKSIAVFAVAPLLPAGGTTDPLKNKVFSALGNGEPPGVPYAVMVAAVYVPVMHRHPGQTRFGRHYYAIGADALAADGGIRDTRVPLPRRAVAETVVMGSPAFGAPDVAARMRWLHAL